MKLTKQEKQQLKNESLKKQAHIIKDLMEDEKTAYIVDKVLTGLLLVGGAMLLTAGILMTFFIPGGMSISSGKLLFLFVGIALLVLSIFPAQSAHFAISNRDTYLKDLREKQKELNQLEVD